MANLIELNQKKRKFVEQNMKLFEEAYIELRQHKPNQRFGPKFNRFVSKARKKFGYSDNTVSIDVWTKFRFSDIEHKIDDRLKKEHLDKPEIKRALGYGEK